MLGSPFDAEDAVQDVLEKVWCARLRRAYLGSVGRRRCRPRDASGAGVVAGRTDYRAFMTTYSPGA